MASGRCPKQFVPLFGDKSLFRLTCERLIPLVSPTRILVVTGRQHRRSVLQQAGFLKSSQLILEEMGRNTATSIALAALRIRALHGDGVMVVAPADHWIASPATYRRTVKAGIDVVRRTGTLMTVGITPRSADTGFGYIRPVGPALEGGARRVSTFIEKPHRTRARHMVTSGRYLWNSGIFIWRASTILDELTRHHRGVTRPLRAWASRAGKGPWTVPRRVLSRIEAVPIDRAVLERSRSVMVLRGNFGWTDLGNWDAFGSLLKKDRKGNAASGSHLFIDSSGCLAVNEGGLTALIGLKDVIAVRAGTTVLVCHRESVQSVRQIAERLR
jgi:mannose-1-phosphate guanylyltransferase